MSVSSAGMGPKYRAMITPSTACTTVRVATVGAATNHRNSGYTTTMPTAEAASMTRPGPTRSARCPTNGEPTRVTAPATTPPRYAAHEGRSRFWIEYVGMNRIVYTDMDARPTTPAAVSHRPAEWTMVCARGPRPRDGRGVVVVVPVPSEGDDAARARSSCSFRKSGVSSMRKRM